MDADSKTLSDLVLAQARTEACMIEISKLKDELRDCKQHMEDVKEFLREWGVYLPGVTLGNE